MRQDRRLRQQVVVCKMAAGERGGVQVLRLPRLAQELSCCLQDPPLRSRRAKPVRRHALGPELRCCLQDCGGDASDPGVAVGCGFGRPRRDSSAGTVSSNRDCGSAIFGDCPGRHRGTRNRRQVLLGDSRRGDGAGSRPRHTPPGGAGTSKAGRPAGSRGNAVHPYEWRFLIPATSPRSAAEFRNCCRVTPASPPMISMADYITGGNAVVLNRG